METDEEKIRFAVMNTRVLRSPKQTLSTFGVTNIYYYIVAVPAYTDVIRSEETVIREGRVIAEKPRIVTPFYLSHLQGFSAEAKKYFDMLTSTHGANTPGLFYAYRNEPKEFNIVSDNWPSVVAKLTADIDQRGDPLASIIKGEDVLWDVSLMKFIYEVTQSSFPSNVAQLGSRGLLNVDQATGLPTDTRIRIEGLFEAVKRGEMEPADLQKELERWGVFEQYQDRFFSLFKKG
jgi:hypothetical protein